jgi:glycosyltransferase involved in cell wall biosynthesis
MKKKKLVSIIVPCFNEDQVIGETYFRLIEFCKLDNFDFEFIFVDDGSLDTTKDLLRSFFVKDNRVKLIFFSRNFGHQVAVSAGIEASSGDAVILIDADLQDPPEVMSDMIDLWENGYDVVYGTRVSREGESFFKLYTAKLFYKLLNKLSDIPIPLNTGDFRLMDRNVVNALNSMPEKDRFIRGMVSWIGFNQISLSYKRRERFAGISKYPLKKMINFGIDGIISFSSKPLKMSLFLGVSSSILSMISIFYVLLLRIFTNNWVEGWTTLMISILFLGGVQLIGIGILGEYIGRIYKEVKRRPLYVINEKLGFDNKS